MKRGKRLLAWCLAVVLAFGNTDLGWTGIVYAVETADDNESTENQPLRSLPPKYMTAAIKTMRS